MSFVKTLAALAIGIAAAKGYDRFRKAGGMDNVQKSLDDAGAEGGLADQAGAMAAKLGVPDGGKAVRDATAAYAPKAAEATRAAEAGIDTIFSQVSAAAGAASGMMSDWMNQLTGGVAGAAAEDSARLMIRAMIQAAKADGTIDDAERAKIMSHLADASPGERAFVEAEMAAPVDPQALASAVRDGAAGQVYGAALSAVAATDGANGDYLKKLAAALGLSDAARDAIHAGMGRPSV